MVMGRSKPRKTKPARLGCLVGSNLGDQMQRGSWSLSVRGQAQGKAQSVNTSPQLATFNHDNLMAFY